MAKRTAAEIFAAARAAGLSVAAATIATAVALGESSGDDTTKGDLDLQDAKWGPSVGLWQIRTLKAETGTGSDRDINALPGGGPARQAQAMYRISKGGTDWTPWMVFTRGIYQKFMGQAHGAAGLPTTAGGMSGAVPLGNTVSGDVDAAVDASLDAARDIALKTSVLALGLVLVAAGVILAARPAWKEGMAVKKAGETKMRSAVGL